MRPQVDGVVARGPNIKLNTGSYRAEYIVSAVGCPPTSTGGRIELKVVINRSEESLGKRSFQIDEVFSDKKVCSASLGIEFSIGSGQVDLPIELQLSRFGGGRYAVVDFRIVQFRL